MIRNILVRNCASFDTVKGVSFTPTKVNFVYGANGSGKTTIANVIKNISAHPDSVLDWGLAPAIQTLVYNRSFIEENFEQSGGDLKGIFTLGKGSIEEIEKIKMNQEKIGIHDKNIIELKGSLDKEKIKFNNTDESFAEKCWAIYKKYQSVFSKAFEGSKGSKQKFKNKVLNEFNNNHHAVENFVTLEKKANEILNSEVETIPELLGFKDVEILNSEVNPIFKLKIIGKEDIDISKMIAKLNNSDWVGKGISYLELNDSYCPFCQQSTTEKFRQQLTEYFDETYNLQVLELKKAKSEYSQDYLMLDSYITEHLKSGNKYLNSEILQNLQIVIKSSYEKNITLIDKKLNEPSILIQLEKLSDKIRILNEIIGEANYQTKKHNLVINNLDREQTDLKSKIWAYLLSELKTEYNTYQQSINGSNKALTTITDKIKTTEDEIRKLKLENQKSESKITSIKPTIDAINKILIGFGFNNFKLSETNKNGFYKIIRENGIDAKNTLSEGEKTFITFLYFYHLTQGSFETDNVSTNKVVVIDDPISSLDSSILFVVSSLVRELIKNCKNNIGNIKQIFVLTHNVYFHKEVTFEKKNESLKGQSFWILRKNGNVSYLENYEKNPIQTSYELLWHEIRIGREKINKLTLFNTLRRILEYYFKILGRFKDDDLINKFEYEEKIVANSLLSWINDGSHIINDDMFIATDDDTIEKYLRVFKRIFEVENHIEHYNMMMKIAS